MKRRIIPRRSFLRGTGGVLVGLPLLEAMLPSGSAAAADAETPRRVCLFFQANGVIRDAWTCEGSGSNFELSHSLQPLADLKSDIIVIEGLRMGVKRSIDIDHTYGVGGLWTGTDAQSVGDGYTAGGSSIDQFIASNLAGNTKFSSLEFGVQNPGNYIDARMCYRAAGQSCAPELDPWNAFSRMFTDFTAPDVDTAALEALRADGETVAGAVLESFKSLRNSPALSADDAKRVDAHMDHLHELQKRIENSAPPGSGCELPQLGDKIDINKNDNFPTIGKLHMDLIATAFACDLTRVASLQWSRATSFTVHTWLGQQSEGEDDTGTIGDHHWMSHHYRENIKWKNMLIDIDRWYVEQFAYLANLLKAMPEPGGNVLDNSLVIYGNELGEGKDHSLENVPFILAGKGGRSLETGRLLRYQNDKRHNDLLVSVARAVGGPELENLDTFGDPEYCSGPLGALGV